MTEHEWRGKRIGSSGTNRVDSKERRETEVSSPFLLSLLSDSNQRPRDYKSRALAN